MVFSDEAGNYARSFVLKIPDVTSPSTAEFLAAPDAAQQSFGSKFPQVVLENDALQVVQLQNLGSMQMCSTPLGLIVEDIKSLLQNFGDVRVCHICKNVNVMDYRLAKLA
ncbi:hypothetical protein C1H46_039262 [Malus baccata]|uniref:RNase H type-1 domain-containing protein n=1 Tax=Malus baccata TaxID=106549 RepID=A0A540KLX7_MALBA|nr:hypothetical protein C1H46_039262 [Malus baccata]